MRISQIFGALLTLALCGPSLADARERPAIAPAARFLQNVIDAALPLTRPPVDNVSDAKLAALMDQALDMPELALFAIGRYRPYLDGDPDGLGKAQRFITDQLRALAYRAGEEFPSLAFNVRDLRIDAEGNRHVLTLARLPKFGDIDVEWVLRIEGASYRVTDIRAFGLTLRHFLRDLVFALAQKDGAEAALGLASPR